MTPAEQSAVAALSESQLKDLDNTLLANTHDRWRKVAMVVSRAMDSADKWPGVPDSYYAERVRGLVSSGHLESQGNLLYMRFSEVRRPESSSRSK
jgi:hypothetical protein